MGLAQEPLPPARALPPGGRRVHGLEAVHEGALGPAEAVAELLRRLLRVYTERYEGDDDEARARRHRCRARGAASYETVAVLVERRAAIVVEVERKLTKS